MLDVAQVTLNSTFRVTWVSSGATASPIAFNLQSGSETMVGSWAGTSSGNGHYYADVKIDSPGLWRGVWFAYVNPNTYVSDGYYVAGRNDTDQPGRYITWDDVVNRFSSFATAAGAMKAASHHLAYAEAEVDAMLGAKFSVPFSNNNLTVKDLVIDLVYLRSIRNNFDLYRPMRAEINSKFAALLSGKMVMITASGDSLRYTGVSAWSNNQDYHPTFSPYLPEEVLWPSSDGVSAAEDVRGII